MLRRSSSEVVVRKSRRYLTAMMACVLSTMQPSWGVAQTTTTLVAQEVAKQLADDPKLFLQLASAKGAWSEPAEPTRIAGPIYFVGTKGLSVWLIQSTQGLILLNGAMPGSGTMIEASIRKLGFRPEDIRILLACHAHVDHVGTHAFLKKISGAEVVILGEEVELLRSGGKSDFHYGSVPEFAFEPVEADRVIADGAQVQLGDVTLQSHRTAGHTRGATTWTMSIEESGKTYRVVFPDGTGINPGYRLGTNPSYPNIADDYRRTLLTLAKIEPDIWLAPHTEVFNFHSKRELAKTMGVEAWVDPNGYATWIAQRHQAYEAALGSKP